MASSSPPGAAEEAAICCMCGDHGLPRELFRCKSCRVRLQHSYCSNLYPRATAYRRCNWCLVKEPPAQAGGATAHAAANANNGKPAEVKRKAAAVSDEERRREGCASRRPPAELGYSVKKKRKVGDERVKDDAAGVKGSCSNNDGAGERKEMMRAGKPARVRVKVQRYKLLAEVISC